MRDGCGRLSVNGRLLSFQTLRRRSLLGRRPLHGGRPRSLAGRCRHLRRSNWRPENTEWAALMEQFRGLKRDLYVRLLSLPRGGAANLALTMQDVVRYRTLGKAQLQLGFDVLRLTR